MEKKFSINKKGQLAVPLITFAVLVIMLLFLAPFMLKIVNSILSPFGTMIGNQSAAAGAGVSSVHGSFVTLWDIVISLAFVAAMLIYLVSAFLVDTHPAFALVFLLAGFFTVIFAPIALDAVDNMWDSPEFLTESNQLTITGFIKDYFGVIIMGVMILGGVILYARIKYGGRGV